MMWKKANLAGITTFGLPAEVLIYEVNTEADLEAVIKENKAEDIFVLGGGSNLIIGPEIEKKKILQMNIKGIIMATSEHTFPASPEYASPNAVGLTEKNVEPLGVSFTKHILVSQDADSVFVKVGAGEVWDDVVAWAVENGYSGIEALSAIPGTAGATPVQNVGAYGTEIKDVLVSVRAYDKKQKQFVDIANKDCNFSYRMSIFKSTEKGRYIITSIILRLSKDEPKIPNYANVQNYFTDKGIINPSLQQIRDAITQIRWSKLPKPEELANCGSFFENPIVDKSVYENLKLVHSNLPCFELPDSKVKIPAGWLIENAGLKGRNFGSIGIYEKNAIVLVNHGGANFKDVIKVKDEIIKIVQSKFGITLETEPEFVF